MENQPILSICIPTYKREYLIEKLINGFMLRIVIAPCLKFASPIILKQTRHRN